MLSNQQVHQSGGLAPTIDRAFVPDALSAGNTHHRESYPLTDASAPSTTGDNSALTSNNNSNPMSPQIGSPPSGTATGTKSDPMSKQSSEVSSADQENPKKRRKCTVRACDACAIRKVKCEAQRPCRHCITNGLNCTQLRERKKSGPKNLHRKTLESINSIADRKKAVADANSNFNLNYEGEPSKSIIVSNNHNDHPIEMVPDSLSSNMMSKNGSMSSKYTTSDLIDVLTLVKQPLILSILQDTTVKTVLDNYNELIDFIQYSIPNVSLDLIITSSDPLHLSKVLVSLSLALVIVENAIILMSMEFNYPYLKSVLYYKELGKSVLFKMLEIFQMIDCYLLYPPSPVRQSFQIFYNQSVSCVNLFYYFSMTRDHDDLYSKQQKVMYLRRAITYYQMINNQEQLGFSSSHSAGEGLLLVEQYKVNELFERLFTTERYSYLTYTNLVNSSNLFDLSILPDSNNAFFRMFKLLNNDDLIFHKLKSHNILMNLFRFFKINHYPDTNHILTRSYMNLKINLINISKNDAFQSVLSQVLLFKVLMIYSNNLQLEFLERELIELIRKLNTVITFNDTMYLKGIHFRLLPQFLQILKINIDFENNKDHMNDLIEFTDKIAPYFSTSKNPEQYIKTNKILFDWFKEVSQISAQIHQIFCKAGSVFSFDNAHIRQVMLAQIHGNRVNTQPDIQTLPKQLHQELDRLRQTQMNSDSTDIRTNFKVLLNDFGNSRLSSTGHGTPEKKQSPKQTHPEPQAPQRPQSQPQPQRSTKTQAQAQAQPQQASPQPQAQAQQPQPQAQAPSQAPSQPQPVPAPSLQVRFPAQPFSNQVSSPSGLSRQYQPSSTLLPNVYQPSVPVNQSTTSLAHNSNSGSYSTIIQNSPGLPIPPMITSTNPRKKEWPEGSGASISGMPLGSVTGFTGVNESSKNLYNLFTQINDDMPHSQNNSLTNLFQFNSGNNLSSMNLNKMSSLSNIRSQGNLPFINSSSTLNLFMTSNLVEGNEDTDEEADKSKDLKSRFLL